MRGKPRITKRDGQWTITRPPFGFRPTADETSHPSHRDAVQTMVDLAEHYAAGGDTELGPHLADQLATVPRWTPLEHRDQPPRRLP